MGRIAASAALLVLVTCLLAASGTLATAAAAPPSLSSPSSRRLAATTVPAKKHHWNKGGPSGDTTPGPAGPPGELSFCLSFVTVAALEKKPDGAKSTLPAPPRQPPQKQQGPSVRRGRPEAEEGAMERPLLSRRCGTKLSARLRLARPRAVARVMPRPKHRLPTATRRCPASSALASSERASFVQRA